MRATMNVPSIAQGLPPPVVDAYWMTRGSQPLGSSALGSTLQVDSTVVKILIDAGWTVASWQTS